MSNREVIKRGGVQFTSAGAGIIHSEYNHSHKKPVHFLQIWLQPNQRGLAPNYQTVLFSDEEKRGRLCLIVSGSQEQEGQKQQKKPITVNQDANVYASLLAKGEPVSYEFGPKRVGYIHLCDTGGRLRLAVDKSDNEEIVLEAGDGAFIESGVRLTITGDNQDDKCAEFLLFDLTKK